MPKFLISYDGERENSEIFDRHFSKENKGFRTKNSRFFKSVFNFILTIVDNINIKLYTDGIHITSLDNSHISLINIYIPKTFFSNYNIKENQIIGLNLTIFMKILSRINSDDELIMVFNEDDINISFINIKYQKHYSLKQMDIESDELDIQPLDNPITINIISKYFNDIINDLSDIGENVTIDVQEKDDNDEHISLIAENDVSQLNMILHNEAIVCKNLQNLKLDFNLKNLQNFSKGYNLSTDMSIEINDSAPLKLSYKLLGNGFIDYYIAPKMEEE